MSDPMAPPQITKPTSRLARQCREHGTLISASNIDEVWNLDGNVIYVVAGRLARKLRKKQL